MLPEKMPELLAAWEEMADDTKVILSRQIDVLKISLAIPETQAVELAYRLGYFVNKHSKTTTQVKQVKVESFDFNIH